MKNIACTIFCLCLFILASCDDKSEDDSYIQLDKSSITIGASGGEVVVNVKTNTTYTLLNVPDWITVYSSRINGCIDTLKFALNLEMKERKTVIVFSANDNRIEKKLEITQSGITDEAFDLNKAVLPMLIKGERCVVKVTARDKWQVVDIPDWITIDPISGVGNADVTITAKENTSPKMRSVDIGFISGDIRKNLEVGQSGLSEVFENPMLGILSFDSFKFSAQSQEYDVKMYFPFANLDLRNKIYLGNLLCPTAQSNTNITEFMGYTFNPITVSSSSRNVYSKSYTPSLQEESIYVKEILDAGLTQDEAFQSDNGINRFYTYRQLHTLGVVNLGLKLDEVISGFPFTQKEMTKKYGLIFSFKNTSFTLDMDLPDYPGALIKESLKAEDAATGVSFINTISYGYLGLLIVESDIDIRWVRIAVNQAISGQNLTQEENELILSSDISCIYFNNKNEPQVVKGHLNAIQAYKDALANKSNYLYPIEFGLADFDTFETTPLSFPISAKQ